MSFYNKLCIICDSLLSEEDGILCGTCTKLYRRSHYNHRSISTRKTRSDKAVIPNKQIRGSNYNLVLPASRHSARSCNHTNLSNLKLFKKGGYHVGGN